MTGTSDAVIPSHPLADLFPMLSLEDADSLRRDIAANGLRERIVILDRQILDGRNRYRGAVGAGVLFGDLPPDDSDLWVSHYRRFNPAQDGDPLAWVISKNLHRRHLSDGQRAMVAARIANLGNGQRASSANLRSSEPVSQAGAAEQLHVSVRSVTSAKEVIDYGAPELVAKVDRGEVAVSAAADVARLPVAEQLRILRENHPREFGRAVREQRGLVQSAKKERRQVREAELGSRLSALPDKRFGLILADPEWQFRPFSAETGMDRAADNHYPTSATDLIASRPVQTIAADECVLLLWVTVPMLIEGLQVMAAWGFIYKSHFIWAKDRMGTGYWNRNQHELLLVGTRGTVPAPAMGDQWPSLITAPVGAHSQKPSFAHEIAEAYFPSLPKIELNARERRVGWDAWGLEAPPAVHITSEHIAVSFAEATPILQAEYRGDNGQELADRLGRPIATIRSWAFRLGLTDQGRSVGRALQNLQTINSRREKIS